MCRLLGYVSMSPVSLQTAVGGGLQDFVNLSSKHADGWGLACAERETGELHACRMPEPAALSSTLKHLASATLCDAAILHLRWATPGMPICLENTHPFIRGKYAFIHNGTISAAIDRLAMPEGPYSLEGDTDSEKYFLIALDCVDRLGPTTGMAEAVRRIHESCEYTSLNAMLLTPDELIVVSRHRTERIPAGEPDDYYDVRYHVSEDRVVVASTGWPQEGWMLLPNNSILRIDRKTREVSKLPIAPR